MRLSESGNKLFCAKSSLVFILRNRLQIPKALLGHMTLTWFVFYIVFTAANNVMILPICYFLLKRPHSDGGEDGCIGSQLCTGSK